MICKTCKHYWVFKQITHISYKYMYDPYSDEVPCRTCINLPILIDNYKPINETAKSMADSFQDTLNIVIKAIDNPSMSRDEVLKIKKSRESQNDPIFGNSDP